MQDNGWNIRLGKTVRSSEIKTRCKSSMAFNTVDVYGSLETQMKMKIELIFKN